DGRGLICGDGTAGLELFDVATGRRMRRIRFSGIIGIDAYWTSPDETRAIVTGSSPSGRGEMITLVELGDAFDVGEAEDLSLPPDSATLPPRVSPAVKEPTRMADSGKHLTVYIGTYTSKTSQGIYRSHFDPGRG